MDPRDPDMARPEARSAAWRVKFARQIDRLGIDEVRRRVALRVRLHRERRRAAQRDQGDS